MARLGLKRAEEALRKHPESSRPAQLGAPRWPALGEREKAIEWLERALRSIRTTPMPATMRPAPGPRLGEIDQALDNA